MLGEANYTSSITQLTFFADDLRDEQDVIRPAPAQINVTKNT
jgi:hypothetical protein